MKTVGYISVTDSEIPKKPEETAKITVRSRRTRHRARAFDLVERLEDFRSDIT